MTRPAGACPPAVASLALTSLYRFIQFSTTTGLCLEKVYHGVIGLRPAPSGRRSSWPPTRPPTWRPLAQRPLRRPWAGQGQPFEAAECYVFLASEEASYTTGQVLHPNGGVMVNGKKVLTLTPCHAL